MVYDLAGKPDAVRLIWLTLIARITGAGINPGHGRNKVFPGAKMNLQAGCQGKKRFSLPQFKETT